MRKLNFTIYGFKFIKLMNLNLNKRLKRNQFLKTDQLLYAANKTNSPQKKLDALNSYLVQLELSPIALKIDSMPFNLNNFKHTSRSRIDKIAPLASVIIASHNSEKTIEFSVLSIINGTYQNIEIIIVDDASQDNTCEIARRLSIQFPQIRLIPLLKNVGVYHARNRGLSESQGEYVLFHDSDDWAHSQRIEECVKLLQSKPQLVAVSCNYIRIDEEGNFFAPQGKYLVQWIPNSLAFRRKIVLEKIGYFADVRFGGDSEYVARLKAAFGEDKHFKIRKPLILASYRKGSLTYDQSPAAIAKRIEYQITWTHWIKHSLENGQSLYRPNTVDDSSLD